MPALPAAERSRLPPPTRHRVCLQLLSCVIIQYNIRFPSEMDVAGRVLSVFNVNLFTLVEFGCQTADFDQFNVLLVMSLWPLALLMLLGGLGVVLRSLAARGRVVSVAAAAKWVAVLKTVSVVVLFLVLPGVSSEIVRSLRCDTFDDGSSFVKADYRISCASGRYRAMMLYAVVMCLVYPVGVPALAFGLLYLRRDVAYPANQSRVLSVVPSVAAGRCYVLVLDELSAADDCDLERQVNTDVRSPWCPGLCLCVTVAVFCSPTPPADAHVRRGCLQEALG